MKIAKLKDKNGNEILPRAVLEFLDRKINIRKSVNISQANTWYDVGISGSDLGTGTYIMQAFLNGKALDGQYDERISGIVAWFSSNTNSYDVDEIPLSKSGHTRNTHNIKFRVLRQPNNSPAKLQISDTIAWSGSSDIVFTFRRLI